MAEPAESSAGPVRSNPLYHDPVLLQMYVEALDHALAEAEVRTALEEFDLIPATARMKMVRDAALVFGSAPQEYENYRQDASSEVSRSYTLPWPSPDPRAHTRAVRQLRAITAALFALVAACGITVLITGTRMQPWLSLGITVTAVAAAAWSARLALGTRFAADLFSGMIDPGPPSLAGARQELMDAVGGTELLAHVRANINASRRRRFGQAFTVISSPGLSEVYDSANRVPTDAAAELASLIDRLDGASIAVAGPRGSGKSTLLREHCEDDGQAAVERTRFEWASLWSDPSPRAGRGDLRCLVAAPVDYVARDFVLYMFGTFCRVVVASFGTRVRELPRTAVIVAWLIRRRRLIWAWSWRLTLAACAVAMIFWERPVARWLPAPLSWVQDACIAMLGAVTVSIAWAVAGRSHGRRWQIWQVRSVRGPGEKDLAAQARRHLARVRYLQTYTSGWSGAVHLPGGAVEGQRSRSIARAEQPLSYPEIVDDFRRFAQAVAEEANRRGDRVFIGVDELDKIGTPDQAERFLNEIKGIFGIPHVYFMVSVSDDALTSFERRGLPLRNAFDSSFDEMIHVRPLTYAESRRLLYRRVIGLTEPYVALCHCLSGGLARDLIRTARQVVRAAAGPAEHAPTLGVISAAVVRDEIRRKLTAITQAIREAAPGDVMDLQLTVHACARHLMPGQAVLTIVDTMTRVDGEEPVAVARLRTEFAAFAYFCATVQETFTDELGSERMIEATGSSGDPGSFDALVAARNALALDTFLSWRLTTEFRKQWHLETRELIKVTADTRHADLHRSSLGYEHHGGRLTSLWQGGASR
jgi:hypothetical protein